ncbi:MAG: SdrD B-like domain-containing protein, partial [Anaerolineae bacterium]
DLNGNGLWDDDEVGLEGVTVTLDTVTSTTTDQYGGYTLSTATEGVHTVVETDPEGYFSTTPNERHVPVELGNGYQVDFGDAPNDSPFAAIYGTVFEDLHNIGQWDDDEVGLEGVTVTLDGVASTTTDQYGSYTFSTATEGIHTVVETDPEGYFSTTPNEVRVGVTLGQGYQIDFGDAPNESPFAAIYGTVFEDTDSNGHWDDDELGIEAVTVTLSGDGSTTTNLYGSYSLSTATEGAHTVVETDPEGYMSTTDNSVPVDVLLGNGYRVDFGDVPFCTCDGDKYEEDDEPELAVELTVGVTQTHDFCDDATDWTYIAAQPGFVYTVTTHSWGQRADTVLHLYDSDGQTLLATSDDFEGTDDFSSYVTWQAPLSGSRNYHVLTTNRSGLIGCQTDYDIALTQKEMYYNLLPIVLRNYTAPDAAEQAMPSTEAGQDLAPIESEGSADPEPSFSPTGIITHTCPDIHEVDDTWELAKPIGDGELQVHSFDSNPVEWAADKDFVWFDIQAGRTITFTVPVITGTWEVELMLYGRNGDPMPETLSHTGQLEWEATTGGRYFLAVSPPKLAAIYGCADVAGYKLQAELQPRWYRYLPIVTRQFGP